MSTICLLGRQPAIGLAELEALYGADAVTPLGATAALVETPIDFARLGGSVKAAKHLTTLETTNPQKVFDYCRRALPEHLQYIPDGKIKLGVSMYGFDMPVAKINANALTLKKVIKKAGRSVRAVPNTDAALSSAQTYHNALTSPVGLELIFVRHGDSTVLGQVTHVQDIDSYTLRDRGRPKRDAFVGMLPPKLAQIIINLAYGRWHMEDGDTATSQLRTPNYELRTILDPFCGTGVILQEALLMGFDVYGTDLSPKMIDYSRANLAWLIQKYEKGNMKYGEIRLELADATKYNWDFSSLSPLPSSLSVACESYLGQPLGGQHPTPEKLAEIMHDCNSVLRGFLRNIASQLPAKTRLCLAIPAWFVDDTLHRLKVLDDLEDMGYNRIDFECAARTDLIYRRDDQIVGRELLVLIKQ
ncbi:hypothetical protein KA093_01710 [Candidatus Saccharibacteria bacterium]|nr:hypothetical protein [Candidatus Saccharibacteria bacterium]